MSTASATSPSSPLEHRDIRSAAQPFKRDRDHDSKWSTGVRPSAGVKIHWASSLLDGEDTLIGGSPSQREKVRPQRQWNEPDKYHGNKAAKPTAKAWNTGLSSGRVFRKIDAQVEATTGSSSDLSRSLLELLPQNTQYTSSAITTALLTAGDEGVLYSFDSVKSPGEKGRKVDLGGLVEQAEKKFLSQQTERMVKESYEVLDVEGESVVLTGGKKKKGSPKTKAVKFEAKSVDEDDGFELI